MVCLHPGSGKKHHFYQKGRESQEIIFLETRINPVNSEIF